MLNDYITFPDKKATALAAPLLDNIFAVEGISDKNIVKSLPSSVSTAAGVVFSRNCDGIQLDLTNYEHIYYCKDVFEVEMCPFTDKTVYDVIMHQLLNDVFFLIEKDKHMFHTILEINYKVNNQALILSTIIVLLNSN